MHAKHEPRNQSTLYTTHFLTATSKTYTQVFRLRRQLPKPRKVSCDVCGKEERTANDCGGCGKTLCYTHSYRTVGLETFQFCVVCDIKESDKKIIDSILAKTQAEVKAMDDGGSETMAKPATIKKRKPKAAKKTTAKKQAKTPVTDVSESPAPGGNALHWVGQPEDGCPPDPWKRPALIVLTGGTKLLSKSEWKAEMKKIGEMCRSCCSPVPPMAVVCKDFAAYEQLRGYEQTPAGPFGAPHIFAAMGKDESITNTWVLPAGKRATTQQIERPEVHEFITRLGAVTTMLGFQLPRDVILYHDLLDRYNPYDDRPQDTCVWEWRMAPTKAHNQATLGITALSKASDFALFIAGPASIKKRPKDVTKIDERLANASTMCNAACFDSYTSPHGDLLRAIIALHCKSTSSCFDRSVMTPDDRVEEEDGEAVLVEIKLRKDLPLRKDGSHQEGLFASESIGGNVPVCEYFGGIMLKDSMQAAEADLDPDHYIFKFNELSGMPLLWIGHPKCKARRINSGETPNVEFRREVSEEVGFRVRVFTLPGGLKKGEEALVDYGDLFDWAEDEISN